MNLTAWCSVLPNKTIPCKQRFLSSVAVSIYEAVTSSVLGSFRFNDEDDHEKLNEIFAILSGARVRTNVILAGKCDSHRHSSTSFSENVVVAKTSYQMLGILSFCYRESMNNRSNNNFFGEIK